VLGPQHQTSQWLSRKTGLTSAEFGVVFWALVLLCRQQKTCGAAEGNLRRGVASHEAMSMRALI